MASDSKKYVSCTFEGVYLGAEPILRDGQPVMTRQDQQPLWRVTIRVGEGVRESRLSITVTEKTFNSAVGDLVDGVYVRIPGSVSVDQTERGTWVSQWGNLIYAVPLAPAAPTPTAAPVPTRKAA